MQYHLAKDQMRKFRLIATVAARDRDSSEYLPTDSKTTIGSLLVDVVLINCLDVVVVDVAQITV